MQPTAEERDTIAAISTAPGRGGIGVVRLSGSKSRAIAESLVRLRGPLQPRRAAYGVVLDEQGARVDDAIAVFFRGPHSYTGEDVVEISVHGSPVVLDWLVRAAVEGGARPARPGEFTERAFFHGRLDLTEAEAVRDLIDAQTSEGARVAAGQLGGSLAAEVRPVKTRLVELIAALEAGIDFAEDDIDTLPAAEIASRLDVLAPPLRVLLESFRYGRLLREGLRLAIAGRPNAGKSSLFNRLVERERAIVTPVAGTTRDVVSERVALDGIPLELLDTAGLRETADLAERIGVERTRQAVAEADAVLVVIDASTEPLLTNETRDLLASLEGRPVLLVRNKADLVSAPGRQSAGNVADALNPGAIWTSATTGDGIAELRAAIRTMAAGPAASDGANGILTNLRQRNAVAGALAAVERARDAAQVRTPHEMILLDAYEALRSLDELTGATTSDDVLALIFSTFCIGK